MPLRAGRFGGEYRHRDSGGGTATKRSGAPGAEIAGCVAANYGRTRRSLHGVRRRRLSGDPMEYKTIHLAFDSGVATITLNRPEKRNAISHALLEELLAALDEIERSPALVVILTGAGKAFCAGIDLEELKALLGKTPEENLLDSARMGRIFRRIYDFPLPTIAAVNGAAIAGGTGFATMCDFTLAVPEAKFGYTEVRIGFVPAIVSTFLLRQVGEKIARDLLLTGRIFDAPEALKMGLINEIVAPEKLLGRLVNWPRNWRKTV